MLGLCSDASPSEMAEKVSLCGKGSLAGLSIISGIPEASLRGRAGVPTATVVFSALLGELQLLASPSGVLKDDKRDVAGIIRQSGLATATGLEHALCKLSKKQVRTDMAQWWKRRGEGEFGTRVLRFAFNKP